MDRCVVLVDAGYLLGAAATLLGRDPDRSALEVDHAELTRALIDEAEARSGLPVLRLLWYDGAFNSQPTSEHRALRVLPDVKVRLGELVKREGRLQQKGVDSYLQRDLTTLARNSAAADVVLVGGDEDLRRALEEAQDFGARVHLWGVEAASAEYNQSQALIAEADRRWVISAEWIKRYVRLRPAYAAPAPPAPPAPLVPLAPVAPVPVPVPVPVGPVPVPVPVGPAGEPAPAATPAVPRPATPADLAWLRSVGLGGLAGNGGADGSRGWTGRQPTDDVPMLREITTGAQAWRDNEEDASGAGRTPEEVGATFGRRWFARADDAQRAAVVAVHPVLPHRLDGELLKYAERQGVDTWAEDEIAKHGVRAGFWAPFDAGLPRT